MFAGATLPHTCIAMWHELCQYPENPPRSRAGFGVFRDSNFHQTHALSTPCNFSKFYLLQRIAYGSVMYKLIMYLSVRVL